MIKSNHVAFNQALLSIFLTLALWGCSATGPIYKAAPEPGDNNSLVYIYRQPHFAYSANDAYFYVNDNNIADLTNDGYTWFHVPSGEYILKQRWPGMLDFSGKFDIKMKVRWEPRQVYYYRLETRMEPFRNVWRVSAVSPEQALSEIRNRKYQPAVGQQKLLSELKQKEEKLKE